MPKIVSNQTNTRQIIRLDYDPLTNYDVTSNSRAGHFFENGVLATSAGAMASGTAELTNTTDGITETYQPMTETSLKGLLVKPRLMINHILAHFLMVVFVQMLDMILMFEVEMISTVNV